MWITIKTITTMIMMMTVLLMMMMTVILMMMTIMMKGSRRRHHTMAKKKFKRKIIGGTPARPDVVDNAYQEYNRGVQASTTTTYVVTPAAASPAQRFARHKFDNEIMMMGEVPKVLMTRDVYEDMIIIVDEVNKEVGWLGTVDRLPDGNFLINEIFMPDQTSHGATCELTESGIAGVAEDILARYGEDGVEKLNTIRLWGHSHNNMGTGASAQDNTQMKEFAKECDDFFIRVIANRNGRLEFTVFIFDQGYAISDCEWEIFEPRPEDGRRERWKTVIASRVKEHAVTTTHYAAGWNGNHYGGNVGVPGKVVPGSQIPDPELPLTGGSNTPTTRRGYVVNPEDGDKW